MERFPRAGASAPPRSAQRLSELEGAVLGLIRTDGPLTAYAVRARFLSSRSTHFSGSAGAVYPLLERLGTAGLVRAAARRQGKRASKLYSITDEGKRALRAWLTCFENDLAAVEFDPIRTRVHFLGALPAARRRRFLAEAAERLEREIAATDDLLADLEEQGDRWKMWGARGALAVLRARFEWITDMRRHEG